MINGYKKIDEILNVLEKFCNDDFEKDIKELGYEDTLIGDYLKNVEQKLCTARDTLREVKTLLSRVEWVEEK